MATTTLRSTARARVPGWLCQRGSFFPRPAPERIRTLPRPVSSCLVAALLMVGSAVPGRCWKATHELLPSRPERGAAIPKDSGRPKKAIDFHWSVEAGAQALNWRPSSDATPRYRNGLGQIVTLPAAISYKTEGLRSYSIETTFGFNGLDMARISYQAPFQRSARQQNMLQQSSSRRAGLEQFTGVLGLYPLLEVLFPQVMENAVVGNILSVQLLYSRRHFYGEARVENSFFYVPRGTPVDFERKRVYGGSILRTGNLLSFQTTFEEFEVNWRLHAARSIGHDWRLGYFESTWTKPSQATPDAVITSKGVVYPVICDTTFKSKGISFRLQPQDETSSGLNVNASFQLGLNNDMELVIPSTDTKSHFMSYEFGAWYNHYFGKDKRGVFITVGATFETKLWKVVIKRDLESHENERLSKVFLKTGTRF